MDSLGAFSKPCERHPTKHISDICTSNSCDHRILCIECKKSHNPRHNTFYEPFLDFLSIPIQEQTSSAKQVSEECITVIDNLAREVNDLFESIRKEVDYILTKLKEDLLNKLKSNKFFEPNDWDKLEQELTILKKSCLDYHPEQLNEVNYNFQMRTDYVEKCILLKDKTSETNRFRTTVDKILNLEGCDKAGLLSKFSDILIGFKKSLLSSTLSLSQDSVSRSVSPKRISNIKISSKKALDSIFTDRQHTIQRDSSVESYGSNNQAQFSQAPNLNGSSNNYGSPFQSNKGGGASSVIHTSQAIQHNSSLSPYNQNRTGMSFLQQQQQQFSSSNLASWNRLFDKAEQKRESQSNLNIKRSNTSRYTGPLNKSQTVQHQQQQMSNNHEVSLMNSSVNGASVRSRKLNDDSRGYKKGQAFHTGLITSQKNGSNVSQYFLSSRTGKK